MRGSRGVGTGGLDYPLQHGNAQRCRSPQEYWFGTFGKAQSYRGRVIIRPLAKKINVKTLDLDSPEETLYFQRKFIAMIMVKECAKLVIGSSD